MFPKLFDEETSEGGEALKAYQNKFLIHNTATTYFCHVYAKLLTGLNSGEST